MIGQNLALVDDAAQQAEATQEPWARFLAHPKSQALLYAGL